MAAVSATAAKTRFLAAASHDLRQPVQSLFFFVAALRPHLHGEGGQAAMTMFERGLDTLKQLLDELLDLSRFDAGGIDPHLEDFAIKPVLDGIVVTYAPIAAAKGLYLVVAGGEGFAVRSDRALLARMVRNLVENAIKYTEQGGVRVQFRVLGERLLIEVHDTGIGIPPDEQELIFTEFHQVGNQERDRGRGAGLGLAIVKQLSSLLDHPITLASHPGKGSVFTIDVPVGAAVPEPLVRASAPVALNGKGQLAVLVDDDAIVLMGLRAMFRDWGYDTLIGDSAEQVLERLNASQRIPEIVIADYRLREGRTGIMAIREIWRSVGAEVPAIVLSGEAGTQWQREASELGIMTASKPATPRQLQELLERHSRKEGPHVCL
jgi:CheY-like chemotaxis protein